ASFADEPYTAGAPLLRAAVGAGGTNGGRLLVAAHHGATDGLGLLAVLAAALGADLVSRARGIADRPPSSVFLASAPRCLPQALVRPPAGIAPSVRRAGGARCGGDILVCAELPARGADSAGAAGTAGAVGAVSAAALTAATSRAAQKWNARHRAPY